MRYHIVLHRPKLLKKCEKITGFKYDYCFSRGHWHDAVCFNVKEGISHLVRFTIGEYENYNQYSIEEIKNKEFVVEEN